MAETSNLSALERAHKYHRSGNLNEAALGYRKFLRKNPQHAGALYLLGCLEYQRGKNEAAVDLLLDAATLAPHEPDYQNALGLALTAIDKYEDAERSFWRALQLENRASFHTNLALLHKKQRRLPEAIASLRRALELQPEDTELLCETGDLLLETNDPAGAVELYQKALAIEPEMTRALYACGCAEIERKEFALAANCFRKATDLEPEWLEARHNLARALYELGQVSQAFQQFQECARQPKPASVHSRAMAAVIVPGVPEANNQTVLDVRGAFARKDLATAQMTGPPRRGRIEGEPLRIGYVSSFFQRDNWMKPVWGLINRHNRAEFHVHLFSDCAESAIQHGYQPQLSDRFFNTSKMSTQDLAVLIREASLDLLIDLNGYSNMRRLPLYTMRPAPVIVGWFNMYATSGSPGFDYLIGDERAIPESEEKLYTEKILRVSGSYLTFAVDYPVPPVAVAPFESKGHITFGSLASQYKITSEVMDVWARILRETPDSSLLLKNKHLVAASTRQYVLDEFAKRDIAGERLLLEGPEEHFAFLTAYDRIDIALDPFPYNGGTTTTEAIWQGVPVITFHGDRWASRTSSSILQAAGLGEFVAKDADGYVELAGQWAKSREHLSRMRRGMREQLLASAACNTEGFAREMERIYVKCATAD